MSSRATFGEMTGKMCNAWLPVLTSLLLLSLQASGYSYGYYPQDGGYAYPPPISAPQEINEIGPDCPFHKDPLSLTHPVDTVVGTVNQDGNYAFHQYPSNIYSNLPDYSNNYNEPKYNNYDNYNQGYSHPEPFPYGSNYYLSKPEPYNPEYQPQQLQYYPQSSEYQPYDYNNNYVQQPAPQVVEEYLVPQEQYPQTNPEPFPEYIPESEPYNPDYQPQQSQYYPQSSEYQTYDYNNNYVQQPAPQVIEEYLVPQEQYPQTNPEPFPEYIPEEPYVVQEVIPEPVQENDPFETRSLVEKSGADLDATRNAAHEEINEADVTGQKKTRSSRNIVQTLALQAPGFVYGDNMDEIMDTREHTPQTRSFSRLFSSFSPPKVIVPAAKTVTSGIGKLVFWPLDTIIKPEEKTEKTSKSEITDKKESDTLQDLLQKLKAEREAQNLINVSQSGGNVPMKKEASEKLTQPKASNLTPVEKVNSKVSNDERIVFEQPQPSQKATTSQINQIDETTEPDHQNQNGQDRVEAKLPDASFLDSDKKIKDALNNQPAEENTLINKQQQQLVSSEQPKGSTADVKEEQVPAKVTQLPIKVSELPVEATDLPLEATELPVEAIALPVEATELPVEATKLPVEATELPVEAIALPVEATELHVKATEPPAEATELHVEATELPVEAIALPVEATELHVKATEPPAEATELHVEATELPVEAIALPVEATELPVKATELPVQDTQLPTEFQSEITEHEFSREHTGLPSELHTELTELPLELPTEIISRAANDEETSETWQDVNSAVAPEPKTWQEQESQHISHHSSDELRTNTAKDNSGLVLDQESYNECLMDADNRIRTAANANVNQASQCIAAADARRKAAMESARGGVDSAYGAAKEQNNYDAEQLFMCANSQFQLCSEERSQLQATVDGFATAANNELAEVSDAELDHINDINFCVANAQVTHENIRLQANAEVQSCKNQPNPYY